jgi:hypothetical protein
VVVAVIVTAAVDVVDIGVVAIVAVVEGVVVVLVIDVVSVLVVVAEEQDANTSDVTIRQVNSIQMTPLFIRPPFFNIVFWKYSRNLYPQK